MHERSPTTVTSLRNTGDPHEIDLATRRAAIADLDDEWFAGLKPTLALFGAGEDSVTTDRSAFLYWCDRRW
ncbi:hypothetical protein [Halococcus saccharolyticus]|uniref:Ribonucleotide reductase beta subunit-like protein n=1 Tax=Halococcus saccharolyticus DSM 5350 TaxID=1227455 RepID=M0MDC9_9EURY|nr:hypothetical protein [Halococcus saccharolyticus]EMA43741.1 Ribonucleotide reductase beta subunit-like protein [Halococcus saccharolyticus DSM 5350]